MLFTVALFAQNEVAPEGPKLLWGLLIPILGIGLYFVFSGKKQKYNLQKKPLFQQRKIKIELKKDRLYYPGELLLTVKNTGNSDIDLDKPLLIFDNFWLKRKFKLKGMNSYSFYPLYLEKGKTHTLQININRFYLHDKKLRKFPKAKVKLFDANGKRLGSKSVYLRKTLVKF
jgi:hypothetical protein